MFKPAGLNQIHQLPKELVNTHAPNTGVVLAEVHLGLTTLARESFGAGAVKVSHLGRAKVKKEQVEEKDSWKLRLESRAAVDTSEKGHKEAFQVQYTL